MLLALDTSTQWMGIALYDGNSVRYEHVWKTQKRHTVELAPAVNSALVESGIRMDQLAALGVALGPGSFTSLRIGLVFIKGLALANHLPVVGIPSLDFLAYSQACQEMPLLCVLQAGRGKLAAREYTQQDGQWVGREDVHVCTAQELATTIKSATRICGEMDEEERRVLARKWKKVTLASPANSVRRPGYLAELAWQKWKADAVDDPITLSPIYLHSADPIPD